MQIRVVLLVAFVASTWLACGGASKTDTNFAKFKALPTPDQAAFNECTKMSNMQVRASKACSQYPVMDQRYQDCHGEVRATYASLPSFEARKSWLTEQGCQL